MAVTSSGVSSMAAAAMVRGNFRHLVVIEDNEVIGLLSMRDIVRCWSGAASDAADAAAGRAAETARA